MKMYHIHTILLALLLGFLYGCKETNGYNEVVSNDFTKPEKVSNITVENFEGGARVHYSLPNSPNLLYVLAEYQINDRTVRQSKSSYYRDTIVVDGFEKSQDYDVMLYTVTRANVRSDSAVVRVHPGTPPYLQTLPSVTIQRDFGGANIRASNPSKQPIGVIVVTDDQATGMLQPFEQHYTDLSDINFSVRGFDTLEHRFGVYITDRWGNISDTLFHNIKPIYEILIPKDHFSEYRLPSDSPLDAISLGWGTAHLWDNSTDDPGWHTLTGAGQLQQLVTFDMGVLAKLSRYKLWERGTAYGNDYSYNHGNPKTWTLWGSASNAPQDVELPLQSNPGEVVGDWVNLGNFDCPPPPSGNPPGQITPADLAFVQSGFEFNISLDAPKVRFIRLAVHNTWGNTDFAHVMELTFWGDTR